MNKAVQKYGRVCLLVFREYINILVLKYRKNYKQKRTSKIIKLLGDSGKQNRLGWQRWLILTVSLKPDLKCDMLGNDL